MRWMYPESRHEARVTCGRRRAGSARRRGSSRSSCRSRRTRGRCARRATTRSPRSARSRATPVPFTPPPMTTTSTSSAGRRPLARRHRGRGSDRRRLRVGHSICVAQIRVRRLERSESADSARSHLGLGLVLGTLLLVAEPIDQAIDQGEEVAVSVLLVPARAAPRTSAPRRGRGGGAPRRSSAPRGRSRAARGSGR